MKCRKAKPNKPQESNMLMVRTILEIYLFQLNMVKAPFIFLMEPFGKVNFQKASALRLKSNIQTVIPIAGN